MKAREKYAIIVAGGSGKRMGSDIPKQFLEIAGEPLLFHTLRAFKEALPEIELILVMHRDFISYWKKLCVEKKFNHDHFILEGGEERFNSVSNGLSEVPDYSLVAVHDAVRPLVSRSLIQTAFELAAEKGSAVPVIKVRDTLRRVNESGSELVDRSDLFIVQTPQVFLSTELKKAYREQDGVAFTDDAAVMEKAGYKIHYFEGEAENLKITYPGDLLIASAILNSQKAAGSNP